MYLVKRVVLFFAALLVLSTSGALSAHAEQRPPSAEAVEAVLLPNEFYIASGDDVFVSAEVLARLQKSGGDKDARLAVVLADPPWAACGVYDANTKLVYTYSRAQIAGYSGASAKLACGSPDWGFRHIKSRHMSQWAEKGFYIGATWSQMAHWTMTHTLSNPCTKVYQSSNDTFQYVAPFQIRNNQGQVVHTFGARVVVARATQNIITAYPRDCPGFG